MKKFDLEREVGRDQTLVVDSALNFISSDNWTEAISKVVMREAEILIPRTDGRMIRSAFLTFPHPLVVGLNRYIGTERKVFEKDDPVTRNVILVRDNWTCYVCNEFGDTMEHLIPESRGGKFTWGNIAVACFSCNGRKGNRTPDEMGWAWPVIPRVFVSKRREDIQAAIHERLAELVTS